MSTPPTNATQHPSEHRGGHEERDVALRPVTAGVIGLVVLLVVAMVLMRLLFGYLAVREARHSPPPNPLAQSFGRQLPPEPRLQTDPRKDLQQLHAEEDAVLGSYGWVDRRAGVVRIPIERAMELLVQHGLPARPASGQPAGQPPTGQPQAGQPRAGGQQ